MQDNLEHSTEQELIKIHEPTFLELILPFVGFVKYRSRTIKEVGRLGINFSDCLNMKYNGLLKLAIAHGLEVGTALLYNSICLGN